MHDVGRRRSNALDEGRTLSSVSTVSKIAISTGGGDAPGLNAVIRSATVAARNRGWEVVGIRDGFNGIMQPEEYPDGGLIELDRQEASAWIRQGIGAVGMGMQGYANGYNSAVAAQNAGRVRTTCTTYGNTTTCR